MKAGGTYNYHWTLKGKRSHNITASSWKAVVAADGILKSPGSDKYIL
jgi:hypothetical protein